MENKSFRWNRLLREWEPIEDLNVVKEGEIVKVWHEGYNAYLIDQHGFDCLVMRVDRHHGYGPMNCVEPIPMISTMRH